jgi:hypothetical protein
MVGCATKNTDDLNIKMMFLKDGISAKFLHMHM